MIRHFKVSVIHILQTVILLDISATHKQAVSKPGRDFPIASLSTVDGFKVQGSRFKVHMHAGTCVHVNVLCVRMCVFMFAELAFAMMQNTPFLNLSATKW